MQPPPVTSFLTLTGVINRLTLIRFKMTTYLDKVQDDYRTTVSADEVLEVQVGCRVNRVTTMDCTYQWMVGKWRKDQSQAQQYNFVAASSTERLKIICKDIRNGTIMSVGLRSQCCPVHLENLERLHAAE